MDKPELLFRSRKDPLDMKCTDGSIINISTSANEEDEIFIVGRFENISNFVIETLNRGNFLKTQPTGFVGILRITGSREKGFPTNRGEHRIVFFNSADSESGKDMFPIEDCIVEQILRSIGLIGDQETLDHNKPLNVFICEGIGVARQVFLMLQSQPE